MVFQKFFSRRFILRSLTVLTLACFVSCTNSGGDDEDSGNNNGNGDDNSTIEGSFRTDCGVIQDNLLVNPVDAADGIPGSIDEVVSENVLIVTPSNGGGKILVKLQGLADDSSLYESTVAESTLGRASRSIVLFPAAEGCTARVEGGGTAMVASVIEASSGDSLAEEILLAGGGDVTPADACGGNLLTSCFRALEEQGEENNPPVGDTASNFLWKPVSESDGNVAVLLNPESTVVVNGETLQDTGASNGRATTARGSKPGCAYGSNVQVQAFDTLGRSVVFPGGATTYTIPNGCSRVEFP